MDERVDEFAKTSGLGKQFKQVYESLIKLDKGKVKNNDEYIAGVVAAADSITEQKTTIQSIAKFFGCSNIKVDESFRKYTARNQLGIVEIIEQIL